MDSKLCIYQKSYTKHKHWGSVHCGNCGELGHVYKKCKKPIQSLGIILYRIKNTIKQPPPPGLQSIKKDIYYLNNIEFLLIRRRNSLGYMEFLRGKYSFSDINFIKSLFNEMTKLERENIHKMDFLDMWTDLWLKEQTEKDKYKLEYQNAEKKFNKLKKGIITDDGSIVTTELLLKTTKTKWIEPEWGFPKGRRNLKEDDIICARREFSEETGYIDDDYQLCKNIKPIEELFLGSNNILYKHIYFIGRTYTHKTPTIDPKNHCQNTEIGDIGWFSYLEANNKIRNYCIEKKGVLQKALKIITNTIH